MTKLSSFLGVSIIFMLGLLYSIFWVVTKGIIWVMSELFHIDWYNKFWPIFALLVLSWLLLRKLKIKKKPKKEKKVEEKSPWRTRHGVMIDLVIWAVIMICVITAMVVYTRSYLHKNRNRQVYREEINKVHKPGCRFYVELEKDLFREQHKPSCQYYQDGGIN